MAPNACMRWYLTLIFCKTAMEAHLQVNVHRVTRRCAVCVDRGDDWDIFISGNSKELLLYIKNTKQKWGRVVANITLQIARNWLTQVSVAAMKINLTKFRTPTATLLAMTCERRKHLFGHITPLAENAVICLLCLLAFERYRLSFVLICGENPACDSRMGQERLAV